MGTYRSPPPGDCVSLGTRLSHSPAWQENQRQHPRRGVAGAPKEEPDFYQGGCRIQVRERKASMIRADRWRGFSVRITFKVNHSIISGVRYIQVVKRGGIRGID